MFVDLGDPRFPCWPGQGRIGVLCLSRDNGLVWLVRSKCRNRCWWACRCGIETQQLAVVGALAKRVVKVNMEGVLSIEIYPRTLSDKEEQSSGS